jgi:long-chain acyl-CoA synthetase
LALSLGTTQTVPELFDDIATLRPTIFPSVPRLFNRLYDKVTHFPSLSRGTGELISDSSFLFFFFPFLMGAGDGAKGHADRCEEDALREGLGC